MAATLTVAVGPRTRWNGVCSHPDVPQATWKALSIAIYQLGFYQNKLEGDSFTVVKSIDTYYRSIALVNNTTLIHLLLEDMRHCLAIVEDLKISHTYGEATQSVDCLTALHSNETFFVFLAPCPSLHGDYSRHDRDSSHPKCTKKTVEEAGYTSGHI